MVPMPKRYPKDQRDRAVRMVLDRLDEYPSLYAACESIAPKLVVGSESLRRWTLHVNCNLKVDQIRQSKSRPDLPPINVPDDMNPFFGPGLC